MIKIPKLSAPLAKAIRTSEGILVFVVNTALAAGAVIDPSKLPPKEAAIVAGALTGLHVASRTLLKASALQLGVGLDAPIPADVSTGGLAGKVAAPLEHVIEQAVQDIGHRTSATQVATQLVSDAEEFANQPPAPPAPGPADPPVPPANRPVS